VWRADALHANRHILINRRNRWRRQIAAALIHLHLSRVCSTYYHITLQTSILANYPTQRQEECHNRVLKLLCYSSGGDCVWTARQKEVTAETPITIVAQHFFGCRKPYWPLVNNVCVCACVRYLYKTCLKKTRSQRSPLKFVVF